MIGSSGLKPWTYRRMPIHVRAAENGYVVELQRPDYDEEGEGRDKFHGACLVYYTLEEMALDLAKRGFLTGDSEEVYEA